MLQKIRDKITGWFAIVFLGAIAIVFIFWGIQFESSVNAPAAKVNGAEISAEAVRRAWRDRENELQQALRTDLPDSLVEEERERLVTDFIRRELLIQRADEAGYRISDADLVDAIAAIPALQVDGRFSRDRYAAVLRSQGRTEAQFEQDFRRDLEVSQLSNALGISAFALPGELRRRTELERETRQVSFAIVAEAGFAAGVAVTPEEIAAWYEKNQSDFMTPETVALQYLRLDLADVAAGIDVTEDQLREFYEQVAPERYVSTERRRARHILIESGDDDAAAMASATKLAERARGGEDFATLARDHSEDPGSKEQGGELGWATRDSFVAPFADALFAMSPGEIRGPVKTQFGYHVLQLEEIDAAHQRSFDEVRSELEADFRSERAQALFYERSQSLADEAFANLGELESAAANLGLTIQTADGFTRSGGAPFGTERKVIDAAFSDEVLQERQNSPAISLGDESVVVLRVTDHQTPTQRPLDDVRSEIEATLRARAARAAAEAAAVAAAARLGAGAAWRDVTGELGAEPVGPATVARNDEAVPQELRNAVFAAAAPAQPGSSSYGTTILPNGDALLFAVNEVQPGSLAGGSAADLAQNQQAAAQQAALAEFSAYVGELERNAKVTRNPKVFE